MSSVFAGGRASSLLTIFNSSTDDASSAFSFEHFSRIDDRLLLESEKLGTRCKGVNIYENHIAYVEANLLNNTQTS